MASTATLYSNSLLSPYLPGLASRDRAKRVDARRKLIGAIYARAGDRPPAAFSALLKELGGLGKQMMDSGTEPKDIITGFYVLDCLADIADDSQVERRLRFLFDILHYLEHDKPLPEQVIRVAGECVGHLSREASTTEMQFLREQYMVTCLSWLRDRRSDSRRLSALVLLHEIALHSPTLFYDEKRGFFDDVKPTLVDPKQNIREAAAEALSVFLSVVYEREGLDAYFRDLLRDCSAQLSSSKLMIMPMFTVSSLTSGMMGGGMAGGAAVATHGALLVLKALLQSCKRPRDVLRDDEYENICEQVLSKLNNPSSSHRAVRHTVLGLLPKLAMVDVTSFWYHFSSRITQHLLTCILKKGGEDQAAAYLSLGNLALVMGPSIFMSAASTSSAPSSTGPAQPQDTKPTLSFANAGNGGSLRRQSLFSFQVVMGAIHEGLTAAVGSGGGGNPAAFNEALSCLSMVMRVSADVKENSAALNGMMSSLFRRGVTQPLVDTFETLCPRISPECRKDLQEMLLCEITSVLHRYCAHAQPNFPSASGSSSTSTQGSGSSSNLASLAAPPNPRDSSSSSFSGGSLPSAPPSVADNLKALLPTFPPAAPPLLSASTLKSAFATTLDLTRAPLTRSGSSGPALDRSMSLSSAANALSSTGSWSMNKLFSSQAKEEEKPADADTVMLCLHTLSHLDFFGGSCAGEEAGVGYVSMAHLTRTLLVRLLHEHDPYIRKAAGLTIATLLHKVAKSGKAKGSEPLLKQTLNRLLTAGMADNSVDIRSAVFGALQPSLDPFLASPANVPIIVAATNDESLEVRQHAIKCLARITRQDSPRLLPLLRKAWVTLMELVTMGPARAAQESLLLVQTLLQVEPSLVKPYVHAFVRQIFSTLDAMDGETTLPAAISVVGELAGINPDDVRPFVSVLMPRLVDSLRENSAGSSVAVHKEASMRALGQLCGATGVTVQGHVAYPDLYPVLLDVLQRGDESSLHLRREAIRTFGILGALGPAMYLDSSSMGGPTEGKKAQQGKEGKKEREEGGGGGLAKQEASGEDDEARSTQLLPLEELYPAMVLRALMKILRDTQASSHYSTALQTLMLVCKRVQPLTPPPPQAQTGTQQSQQPCPSSSSQRGAVWRPSLARFVMLGLAEILPRPDLTPEFKASLLEQFGVLIEIIGQQAQMQQGTASLAAAAQEPPVPTFDIRDYVDVILKVLRDHWESHMSLCLSSVLKVHVSMGSDGDSFRLFLSHMLPLMIATVIGKRTQQPSPAQQNGALGGNRNKTIEILDCLGRLRTCLAWHFRQILPELLYLTRDCSNKTTQRLALLLLIHSSTPCPSDLPPSPRPGGGEDGREAALRECANLIIHALLDLLLLSPSNDVDVQRLAMNALLLLVSKLRLRFVPYILSVRKVVVAYVRASPLFESYLSTYDALLLRVLKNRPLPPDLVSLDNPWGASAQEERRQLSMLQTQRSKALQHADTYTVKRSLLEPVWDSSGYTTSSDWAEWIRRLSVELIRQSPSVILRPCSALAQVHSSLAMGLFDVAFVSVWTELLNQGVAARPWEATTITLIDSLEMTLKSPSLPPEVLNKLLNLVEFMELRDRPLPIDIRLLAAQSERAQAYAKCLKYREMEFRAAPTPDCIEALISVYNQLGLREAAMGILRESEVALSRAESLGGSEVGKAKGGNVTIRPSWLEKIHQWEKALSLYEAYTDQHDDDGPLTRSGSAQRERRSSTSATQKYGVTSSASGRHWKISSSGEIATKTNALVGQGTSVALDDLDLVAAKVGKLRCLDALGDYPMLLEEAKGLKQKLHRPEFRAKPKWKEWVMQVLLLGTKAAFSLGQWQDMADFIATRSRVLPNEAFLVDDDPLVYEAMLKIVRNDFNGAQDCIERMRSRLAPVISSLLKESYTRAYHSMVTAQQLAELEEVIQYKKVCQSSHAGPSAPGAQVLLKHLRHKWDQRFSHAAQEVKVLRRLLSTRSIILRPSEDLNAWLHLANVCRRSGALTLCGNVLQTAGAVLPSFATTGESAVVCLSDDDDETARGEADHDRRMPPLLRYAVYKFLWAATHRAYALQRMLDLSGDLEARRGVLCTSGAGAPTGPEDEGQAEEEEALLGKVYVRIGEWQMGLNEDNLERPVMEEVMGYLQKATELRHTSYRAWHSWARMNNHMVEKLEQATARSQEEATAAVIKAKEMLGDFSGPVPAAGGDTPSTPGAGTQEDSDGKAAKARAKQASTQAAMLREATIAKYASQAIRGFLRSISLGQNANQRTAYILQDTLRLFTLWFRHGKQRIVSQEIEAGLDVVSVSTWLGVVPQLIARIDSTSGPVSSLIRRLLIKVGRAHPQALIYPITLAANSTNEARKDAALTIMADMRTHSPLLVDEAEMVSREMINVAITRQELWHEGLEEASRLYFGEKHTSAAIHVLEALHKIGANPAPAAAASSSGLGTSTGGGSTMDASTTNRLNSNGNLTDEWANMETIRTVAFYHCFEREVEEARAWLKAYKKSKDEADICQAWEIYCSIFRQITKHLNGLKNLDLRHVAPSLLQAHDLKLAVPGTYTPDAEVVRIGSFQSSVLVLTSKQRPRRLTIMGSDGKPYMFLLKGHEDLRQDERVMQLFGLINVLLENHELTSRSNLRITRYAVMPLSSNSGIIGWVKNCDTMHQLIKDYRESQKVRLNVEHRLILSMAPDYDKLPIVQKCEVFTTVQSQTRGMELSKMLWLKSASSEVWLERRTNYTRSLAVMSMAGYILGLGDRHPSNLMIDRISGRIVHIDFGDCFEVAMTRTKFPERVPFRLTRMLINAMEAGGIEGSFRITCENVMEVLRGNRDSLMAMLEAFVHDPLISWRLLAGDTTASFEDRANSTGMLPEQPGGRQDNVARTVPRGLEGTSAVQGVSLEDLALDHTVNQQQVNQRALVVIQRIQTKLLGRDFREDCGPLTAQDQVDRLIRQATSVENLCQLFMGWCPFW